MHIHARSRVNQSEVSQGAVSQNTASLNNVFERLLEHLRGTEAGSNNVFCCVQGSIHNEQRTHCMLHVVQDTPDDFKLRRKQSS